jgi:hypothetical protein
MLQRSGYDRRERSETTAILLLSTLQCFGTASANINTVLPSRPQVERWRTQDTEFNRKRQRAENVHHDEHLDVTVTLGTQPVTVRQGRASMPEVTSVQMRVVVPIISVITKHHNSRETVEPPLKSLASMWERTLQDLVRGLRANKKDEAKFIAKAVDEIRQEIKSDDMELKAGAVLKLTYVRTSQLSCFLI